MYIPSSHLYVVPPYILTISSSTTVAPFSIQAEAKSMRLIIIVVAALHAGLALTFKVLFFSYYVVKAKGSVSI
jgi:hypothetical protein